MRNPETFIEINARRPGDRTDVANEPNLISLLGEEVVRLARLATSIHLAEQARHMAEANRLESRSSSMREVNT
ncbi:MAG: hypothetical protein O7G85_02740 [Planctomycetota bacterium]|nr:hypothetical protein [Planctomycetota bacterium]